MKRDYHVAHLCDFQSRRPSPHKRNAFRCLLGYGLLFELYTHILIDFSLTVKAATLIFIPGRGLAISSAKEEKSGFI